MLPAPYLFGDKEAGMVLLRNKQIGNKLAIAVAKGLAKLSSGQCDTDYSIYRILQHYIITALHH